MNRCHKHLAATPLAVSASIIAMGHSLEFGCTALAQEPTIQRCDQLMHKLKTSEQAISQFRRGLIERDPDDETT